MKYKPTWKDFFILTLLVIVGFYSCLNGKQKDLIDGQQASIEYKDLKFDSLLNVKNQVVAEKEVVETTHKETIKDLSAKVFELEKREEKRIKEVYALVRLAQKGKIHSVLVPYTDTLYADDTSLIAKNQVVIPPANFKDSTEYYAISGTVLLEGVRINSVVVPDTLSFRIAEQRPKGIIRRITEPNRTVIQAIHSNKLFETTGLQSIVLKQKTNRWNRWIKPTLVGLAAGFVTYKVLK